MSKKNLARSAIEGGKGSSQYDSRVSNSRFRARNKAFCRKAKFDPDIDCSVSVPSFWPDGPAWTLKHAIRWLEAQVERSWSEVYSEMKAKFGGVFIRWASLFKHLLHEVAKHPWDYSNDWADFVVDEDGILRMTVRGIERRKRHRYPWNHKPKISTAQIETWLDHRSVIERDSELFWGIPVSSYWVECHDCHCDLYHVEKVEWVKEYCKYRYSLAQTGGVKKTADDKTPFYLAKKVSRKCFRYSGRCCQGDKLTATEKVFWNSLEPSQRERFRYGV